MPNLANLARDNTDRVDAVEAQLQAQYKHIDDMLQRADQVNQDIIRNIEGLKQACFSVKRNDEEAKFIFEKIQAITNNTGDDYDYARKLLNIIGNAFNKSSNYVYQEALANNKNLDTSIQLFDNSRIEANRIILQARNVAGIKSFESAELDNRNQLFMYQNQARDELLQIKEQAEARVTMVTESRLHAANDDTASEAISSCQDTESGAFISTHSTLSYDAAKSIETLNGSTFSYKKGDTLGKFNLNTVNVKADNKVTDILEMFLTSMMSSYDGRKFKKLEVSGTLDMECLYYIYGNMINEHCGLHSKLSFEFSRLKLDKTGKVRGNEANNLIDKFTKELHSKFKAKDDKTLVENIMEVYFKNKDGKPKDKKVEDILEKLVPDNKKAAMSRPGALYDKVYYSQNSDLLQTQSQFYNARDELLGNNKPKVKRMRVGN